MSNIHDRMLHSGIIAICRKVYGSDILHLCDALYAGGVRFMEVTFDQSDPDCIEKTSEAIKALSKHNLDMCFGTGTVLSINQVQATLDCGGQYVISPNVNVDIIKQTKKLGMVSIPGAMTPSEIVTAHEAGADFVKLFPCGYLGAAYMKVICSPINHVKLIATGAVTTENLPSLLEAGARGAGIGSYLSDAKLISSGRFDVLKERASELVKVFQEHNK